MVRIAVVDHDLCKPHRCSKECIRFCPINRSGGKAIELSEIVGGKALIHEKVCVGCGICVKKCPYEAITIVNLPDDLEKRVVHRYGPNAFKLYGLPQPQQGVVVGIIGKNGIGKTTSIRILSGELIPNLGKYEEEPNWDKVLRYFRGTELYQYFRKLVNGEIRAVHKIQHVDLIRKYVKGTVKEILTRIDERGLLNELKREMNLEGMLDSKVSNLSGGELQKFAIAAALLRDASAYFFDEPSSYLDVKERLSISSVIRSYIPKNSYVIVVEHDLAVLDYISDYVAVVYGEPGAYGIYSKVYAVGSGINHFLLGFLPAENMRIRKEPIIFHTHAHAPEKDQEGKTIYITWLPMRKRLGKFVLEVEEGEAYKGEVIGVLGPNAIGKTTFIRLLAGDLKPDEGVAVTEGLRISYKPQYIRAEHFPWSTVGEALNELTKDGIAGSEWFQVDVIRRLRLHRLQDRSITSLSGGELQKFAIAVTLAKEADIYLLDEPSAYIDVEERLTVAKAIKRVSETRKTVTFLVDHDVAVIDYVADRVMVFNGEPGSYGRACKPTDLRKGMNAFLKAIGVTFRRDLKTGRPRVNKPGSYLDRKQKSMGEYYYIPSS